MITTREDIVNEARSWVNVPWKHQGRSKRFGVDCAGLGIEVAKHFGVLPADFDINGYTRYPDGTMRKLCDEYLVPVQHIEIGCMVLIVFSEEPQHLAIVGNYKVRPGMYTLIHSLQSHKRVVEHRIDNVWQSRIVQAYRFPGVA